MRLVGCLTNFPNFPPCNFSSAIFPTVRSLWPSLRPSIYVLVWISQIFVDALSSSQLPLRISPRPSDLRLWTQSPLFVLCNKLVKAENLRVVSIDHGIDQSNLQTLRVISLTLLCMHLRIIPAIQATISCVNQQFYRNT